MLFAGTTLVQGHVKALVTGTGMATEMGKISKMISSTEDETTPLKQALNDFGNTLGQVIAVICLLVWFMNADKFVETKVGVCRVKAAACRST